jgi:hypothetical protein
MNASLMHQRQTDTTRGVAAARRHAPPDGAALACKIIAKCTHEACFLRAKKAQNTSIHVRGAVKIY